MMDAERQRHLDYLDGWRGISIFLVLAGHFSLIPTIHGHDLYTARAGVEFFFVLSGRLMANILFINITTIRKFYWRRFSRIFPALLWLVFALLVSHEISISDAVLALTFIANYVPPSEPLAHVWSLCVEEHSYIILSVIAIISRHRRINVATVLFSISAVAMVSGAIQTWIFHRGYEEVYRHSDVKISSVFIAAAMFLQFRKTAVPPICRSLRLWLARSSTSPIRCQTRSSTHLGRLLSPLVWRRLIKPGGGRQPCSAVRFGECWGNGLSLCTCGNSRFIWVNRCIQSGCCCLNYSPRACSVFF